MSLAIKMEIHLIDWGYEVLAIFSEGEAALQSIVDKKPDFVLMDINLTGYLTGIEVAERIIDLDIAIVFITGMNNAVSFDAAKRVKGISYLVKPFDMLTLKGSLEMSGVGENESLLPQPDTSILLRRGHQLIPVEIEAIQWLESDGNYCHIFTTIGRFSVRKSLIKFIEKLPMNTVVKIHRQYAVSIKAVEGVFLTRGELVIANGKILPIGRTYKEDLLSALKKR